MTVPIKQSTRKHILHEITRSLCPDCRRQFRDDPERAVVDTQVLIRDGAVYLRKRCPEHGWHGALVLSDAQWYLDAQKHNKPGATPYDFSMETRKGCPFDCGLCPEHHLGYREQVRLEQVALR